MSVLRFCVFSGLVSATLAAAPAAPQTPGELESLIGQYYSAIHAEDLEALGELLYLPDEDHARRTLLSYATVFKATDVTIGSVDIVEVQLDDSGAGGVVFTRVTATIANADGSDHFKQTQDYALVVGRHETGWRIIKVTTPAQLEMARRIALLDAKAQELAAEAPEPLPAGSDEPPADVATGTGADATDASDGEAAADAVDEATTTADTADAPTDGGEAAGTEADVVVTPPELLEPPAKPVSVFFDDFARKTDAWDVRAEDVDWDDGQLRWEFDDDDHRIRLRRAIPMEDVAIIYEAKCDEDGLVVTWTNAAGRGYGAALGADENEESALLAGKPPRPVKRREGEVFDDNTWHRYEIERRGATLTARCDGKVILTAQVHGRLGGTGHLTFTGSEDAEHALRRVVVRQRRAQVPTGDVQTAYQAYIAAYNRFTKLSAEGKANTPAGREAYRQYEQAKAAYERTKRE
ncbi:MAG: hypothetical protein KGY99_05370 [Phycisphaerae bacterium]|nr:hypothetical protein [Phycisphaerae bacterium]